MSRPASTACVATTIKITRVFFFFVLRDDFVHLSLPIGWAKTAVDQRQLRGIAWLLLQRLGERGVEILRPPHTIDDHQGHVARTVGDENLARKLIDVVVDILGLGRSGHTCRPIQRLLCGRQLPKAGIMLFLRIDPPDRIAGRCLEIHRPEPPWFQRCGNPEAACGTTPRLTLMRGSFGFASAKGFELSRGRAARTHELHFIEHPLCVFVKQRELHRPDCA